MKVYRVRLPAEGAIMGVPVTTERQALQALQAMKHMSPTGTDPTVFNGHWAAAVVREGLPEKSVELYMEMAGLAVDKVCEEQAADQVDLHAFLGQAGTEALVGHPALNHTA